MNTMQKNNDKVINWKKGVTDFNIDSVYVENIEVKVIEGQAYLIDHPKNTFLELPDSSYTDFIHYKDLIVLSSFVKIDIFHLLDFKVEFKIDDVDGIKLNKVKSRILHGKFNQIDQDGDLWIDFRIDLSSLEFHCDHGRMWLETTMKNGIQVTNYRTMDLKK